MNRRRAHWLVLSDGARPTEDIYFLASVAPWLQERGARITRLDTRKWRHPLWCWPWLRGLMRGAHVIVCRGLALPWCEVLESERSLLAGVYYVIDDDLSAAAQDHSLPDGYRQRMADKVEEQKRLLPLADEVIACSDQLARTFVDRHRHVSILTPGLIAVPPSLEHFRAAEWRVGFHGTRAHLQDLEHIVPALASIHEACHHVQFELMLGRFAPPEVASLKRVSTPSSLPWKNFLDYQCKHRIHIGLAPLWPTAFNAGKSYIKFLDITLMGGVGIYSQRSPYKDLVSDEIDGLLAEDHSDHWQECMRRLLAFPQDARRMALAAADKAQAECSPELGREFWLKRQAS
uniref:glycosyltransferase n=1 Tax=Halomonas sp. TaxID=1486246 RepID=UPI00262DEDF3|nr:glycosyltransferase [Halomonas sp.]